MLAANNETSNGMLLSSAPKLILMRHGESVWNKQNLFTAWVDIPLSQKGIEEALAAGKTFSRIPVDVVFTSQLIRAKITSMLTLAQHASGKTPFVVHAADDNTSSKSELNWYSTGVETPYSSSGMLPIYCAWQLNERCYGELQGLNKEDCSRKWGAEQVKIWRRSYNVPPPQGESLEMTAKRAVPYFNAEIIPRLVKERRNVLIVAHGSTLRAIVLFLQGILDERGDGEPEGEFVELEFENGRPLCYVLHSGSSVLVECSVDEVQAAHT